MELPQSEFDHFDDLRTRAWSAALLLFVAAICISAGGILFTAFIILAAILTMKEWESLTSRQMLLLRFAGYPYVIVPAACLVWMRGLTLPSEPGLGLASIITLISVISAVDIGAYFVGTKFGKHKLAPSISPHKSWEGLGGGVIAAVLVGLIASPYVHVPHSFFSVVWASVLIALLAQAGDLFESKIKRMANVKNSGNLLPGHGGLLDRLDGYMFATPMLSLLIYYATRG